MQYLKLGPVKIPCKVKNANGKKYVELCGVKLPFSTELKNGEKVYKIFFLECRLPFLDKIFFAHNYSNYQARNEMSEEKQKEFLSDLFYEKVGYRPDFDNPKTMNEKIFWMKLNWHDPLITKCCDKFCVKDYVTEVIGEEYIVPTIASWEKAEDIDFSVLPDKFVLKVNWSSGYNIIVRDKSRLNEENVRKKIDGWMLPHQNSYYKAYNWGYKNMKPVVYAEKYIEQMDGQVYDYKFLTSYGKVKMIMIATNRGLGDMTKDFFDIDFNHLPFTSGTGLHADPQPEKPKNYEKMIELAEKLAKPFPFVRVDFYEIGDKIYVGEMTFYPGGGLLPVRPMEWEYKYGDMFPIPDKKWGEE